MKIVWGIILVLFSVLGVDAQAFIFRESFENISQWQKELQTERISLENNTLVFGNLGGETVIESTAMIVQNQDFSIHISLDQASLNFGIVFKNTATKDLQLIKFTSEGVNLDQYNTKTKEIYTTRIGDCSPASYLTLRKENGVTSLIFGVNNYSLEIKNAESLQLGLWLGKETQIGITQFDIVWENKEINNMHFLEDSPIEKKNLGSTVNSAQHEIKPTISEDGKVLYFTRKNLSDNLLQDDAYVSQYQNNQWGFSQKMASTINDQNHNSVSGLTEKGSSILVLDQFARGKKIKDSYRIASLENGEIGKARKIKIADYENNGDYISACISSDGKVIILSLENNESKGASDLFVTFKNGKSWSKPKNLGVHVNTLGNEFSPFLSYDNSKLYFSSNGWPGYGTQDIFVAERQGSWTSWSEPKNLGEKVNTNFWDAYFSISTDETVAMICSNNGQNGGMDIFELRAEKRNLEEPLLLQGYVYDSLTMLPIPYAQISIKNVRNADNKLLYTLATDSLGYFETTLAKDIDYDVLTEKQYYNAKNDQIWYKRLATNTVKRNYYLSKYSVGQRIGLEQIYFEQGRDIIRPLSLKTIDKLHQILADNPEVRILIAGHTDNQGDSEKNQKLSEQRTERIKNLMIAQGIDATRMETKGYGQEKPIAPNDTEFNMRLNRRVEFIIIE